MSESSSPSRGQAVFGWILVAAAVAAFAVRLLHDGPYAMPRGGTLIGGLGSLLAGVLLLWSSAPGWLRWPALVGGPVVLFLGLYGTMAELEETVSLYAFDSSSNPVELRLWIVDREDGEWVGMPRAKALEHSLDGARLQVLRGGEVRCVVPALFDDRPNSQAVHQLKLEKYAVASTSAAVGLYPSEAGESTVALRLDPCEGGE